MSSSKRKCLYLEVLRGADGEKLAQDDEVSISVPLPISAKLAAILDVIPFYRVCPSADDAQDHWRTRHEVLV
jgi:hypothetical protein